MNEDHETEQQNRANTLNKQYNLAVKELIYNYNGQNWIRFFTLNNDENFFSSSY